MYLYYLGFRDETHSEETNVSCFNFSAVNHSGCNVLWGGAITQHTIHLTKQNAHIQYCKKQNTSASCIK